MRKCNKIPIHARMQPFKVHLKENEMRGYTTRFSKYDFFYLYTKDKVLIKWKLKDKVLMLSKPLNKVKAATL